MLKYLLKRLLMMIPMIVIISLLVFIALDFTPGDAFSAQFSPETISSMSKDQLEALRESAGLNAPRITNHT